MLTQKFSRLYQNPRWRVRVTGGLTALLLCGWAVSSYDRGAGGWAAGVVADMWHGLPVRSWVAVLCFLVLGVAIEIESAAQRWKTTRRRLSPFVVAQAGLGGVLLYALLVPQAFPVSVTVPVSLYALGAIWLFPSHLFDGSFMADADELEKEVLGEMVYEFTYYACLSGWLLWLLFFPFVLLWCRGL